MRHLIFYHPLNACGRNLSDILPALTSPLCALQRVDLYQFRCSEDALRQLAEYYKAPSTFCMQELVLYYIVTTMADDEFLQMWIDVMTENQTLAVRTFTFGQFPELTKQTSDLLAQDQRQLQICMPKAVHVAAKRPRIE